MQGGRNGNNNHTLTVHTQIRLSAKGLGYCKSHSHMFMSYSINKKRNYPRKVGTNTENIVSIAVKNYLVQKGCMYHPVRKQRIIYVIEQRQGEELHTSSRELKPESGK